jgi:hypothetical protein
MSPPKDKLVQFKSINALKAYCPLFFEITARTELIGSMLSPHTTISDQLKIEISYLQFRKICELISVGCLILHEELPLPNNLNSEWHAGKILTRLSKLHKNFFPIPGNIEQSSLPNGGSAWMVVEKTGHDLFDIQKLQKLYGQAGEKLHFGTIKSIGRVRDFNEEMQEIRKWLDIMLPIVNSQIIKRKDSRGIYFIDFKAVNGKPSVSSIEINDDGSATVNFIEVDI